MKRYSFNVVKRNDAVYYPTVSESVTGNWVEYSDVYKIEAENAILRKALELSVQSTRDVCAHLERYNPFADCFGHCNNCDQYAPDSYIAEARSKSHE